MNNNSRDEKVKKIPLTGILGYVFGALLYLSACVGMVTGDTDMALITSFMASIIFPPAAKHFDKHSKYELTRGLKIFLFVCAFFLLLATSKDRRIAYYFSLTQPPANVSEAATPILGESCSNVAKKFDATSGLTDLQKDEVWTTNYKGKFFEWDLQVVEVSKGTFGGFTVQFKCKNSNSFIQDVQLNYPGNAKHLVKNLKKDHLYKIRGKLEKQSTLLGMSGEVDAERSLESNQ
jgi:hypothetical protein